MSKARISQKKPVTQKSNIALNHTFQPCLLDGWAVRWLQAWKATKEYLNHRGTKIRVFQVRFQTPFLQPFFPSLFPPLSLSGPVPSAPPIYPPLFLTSGKLGFRYPYDLRFSVLLTDPRRDHQRPSDEETRFLAFSDGISWWLSVAGRGSQAVLHGVPLTVRQLLRQEGVLLTLWMEGLEHLAKWSKVVAPSGGPLRNSMMFASLAHTLWLINEAIQAFSLIQKSV